MIKPVSFTVKQNIRVYRAKFSEITFAYVSLLSLSRNMSLENSLIALFSIDDNIQLYSEYYRTEHGEKEVQRKTRYLIRIRNRPKNI